METVVGDIYKGLPHTGVGGSHDGWWPRAVPPPPCYQVDVLFLCGEEVRAASGEPAPNLTAEERKAVNWPGNEKERE